MKAKKFEQQSDDGVDLIASLDLSKAKRVLQEQRRVNVDFPKDPISTRSGKRAPVPMNTRSVSHASVGSNTSNVGTQRANCVARLNGATQVGEIDYAPTGRLTRYQAA